LLYVGGLSPHKNLPRLISAFARSGLAENGVRLVLVGDTGDVFHTHVPELKTAVQRRGLEGSVVFTGFVPDDDLVYLDNRAEALVQPSLMEGFGLPPVEAMACGTPVISSTAGSLPEVVGDAGIYFNPLSVDAIATALRVPFVDPSWRPAVAARALARANRFTWKASAQMLLAVFDELGGVGDWRAVLRASA
jgi:glycosyltransferase involved in cell wall biosynthesis